MAAGPGRGPSPGGRRGGPGPGAGEPGGRPAPLGGGAGGRQRGQRGRPGAAGPGLRLPEHGGRRDGGGSRDPGTVAGRQRARYRDEGGPPRQPHLGERGLDGSGPAPARGGVGGSRKPIRSSPSGGAGAPAGGGNRAGLAHRPGRHAVRGGADRRPVADPGRGALADAARTGAGPRSRGARWIRRRQPRRARSAAAGAEPDPPAGARSRTHPHPTGRRPWIGPSSR